jgi:hypothetical protein
VLEPSGDDFHFHSASGLPDHRGVLFITHRKQGPDTLELLVEGQRKQLLRLEGSSLEHPIYSPSGHLLFTRGPANVGLWAVPFSLSQLEVTGEPFLVAAGAVTPSLSRTLRLAFMPVSGMPPSGLTWVDRTGRQIGRLEDLRVFDRWPVVSKLSIPPVAHLRACGLRPAPCALRPAACVVRPARSTVQLNRSGHLLFE